MNRLAMVGTAMCSCAIALAACTQPGASDSVAVAVPSAAVFETMDRDDQENGQFTLAKFCEQGWKMPDGSIDACAAAYAAANERGDQPYAKQLALLACSRDFDEMQCLNVDVLTAAIRENQLALLQRAVGDNPRHWDVGDPWEVAAATTK